ncbi:MAG: GxxExxY protein [Bacteroidetes bacterium]|nr:MAG: GxxExxY protein [Bacteroidota bacterium]
MRLSRSDVLRSTAIEFLKQGMPYYHEKVLEIQYKGIPLQKTYIADFVCYDKIIVELKALNSLSSEHIAQVLNYLKATGYRLRLLINFGARSLEYKRIIC